MSNKRLTITEVAKAVGVTPRTIMRWEKTDKIRKPKRDWRGWRFYHEEDIDLIKGFFESSYEYNGDNRTLVNLAKETLIIVIALTALLASSIICAPAYADPGYNTNFGPSSYSGGALMETPTTVDINLDALPAVEMDLGLITEDIKYTLGPKDVIEITVRRHPEFSGRYAINSEGKIEYKFVGDIIIEELTKAEVRDRLAEILSEFIIEPEIDVRIAAYLSKVFYVVGDVRRPGKFYMRGNTVTLREALMQSGLPTQAAAMRRCRIITPNDTGKKNYVEVDVFSLLYEGNLKQNLDMQPGDVLYMPSTVIAKIIRVVSPITSLTGHAAGAAARGLMFVP